MDIQCEPYDSEMTTLVWLRDDLRLSDSAALSAAAEDADGAVVLYLLDEVSEHLRPLGGAAKWWLHQSLRALEHSLGQLGIPLVLRRGAAEEVIPAVARACGADRVLWKMCIRDSNRPVACTSFEPFEHADIIERPKVGCSKKRGTIWAPVSYTHLDVYKRQPKARMLSRSKLFLSKPGKRTPDSKSPVFCCTAEAASINTLREQRKR